MSNRRPLFLRLLRRLRREFPAPHPVRVYLVKSLPGNLAECEFTTTKRFIIRVTRTTDEQGDAEKLLHEWAHMLIWHIPDHGDIHNGIWGATQAKLYSWYEKEFLS